MIHKCLQYWMQAADEVGGVHVHPQIQMDRLGLGNYYRSIPVTICDCWLFLFEEWPDIELPSYIEKKEFDDEVFPQLKPRDIENEEMKTKKKATKRWWKSAPHTGGDPVRELKAAYERLSARGYLEIKCVCTQERYFLVKRIMREAGLDIPIRIVRCSQKQPKFTYKTIRRDCAKRNR